MRLTWSELQLKPISALDVGAMFYYVSARAQSLALGIIANGGVIFPGRVIVWLSGEAPFTAQRIEGTKAYCIEVKPDELAIDLGSTPHTGGEFCAFGTLTIAPGAVYLSAQLKVTEYDEHHVFVNTESWTLEQFHPSETFAVISDWTLTTGEKTDRTVFVPGPGQRG